MSNKNFRCLFLSLLLITAGSTSRAQSDLEFNKRFVESEDRWVAFKPDSVGNYIFGFIYIDAQAGLTLNYEGTFRVDEDGRYVVARIDTTKTMMKVRLTPNNVRVAFIPSSHLKELAVQTVPYWLANYKGDTASVAHLYRWGFLYNGWNECAKALEFLERANQLNPAFEGLQVELAFSYNCLRQFDKSIVALQAAMQQSPTDAYVHKEYIYTLIETGQMKKAEEAVTQSMKVCPDTEYFGEECYNLLHGYYEAADHAGFDRWVAVARKWATDHKEWIQSIDIMEKNMSKKAAQRP